MTDTRDIALAELMRQLSEVESQRNRAIQLLRDAYRPGGSMPAWHLARLAFLAEMENQDA